jgi:hypothetical protein
MSVKTRKRKRKRKFHSSTFQERLIYASRKPAKGKGKKVVVGEGR